MGKVLRRLLIGWMLIGILVSAACVQTETPAAEAKPTPTATAEPTPKPTPEPTPEPTATPEPTEIPMSDPVITLIGGETYTVDASFAFTDPGAEAADYLGADLTDRITVEGEVIPYAVDRYTLTYTVTDDCGNTTQVQRTVEVQSVAMPEIVQPPEKTIYLTFDDGPSSHTGRLLDVLKKYDVKATFFLVGKMGRTELIRRAYEEGHSIGIHCYSHEYDECYASDEAYLADFMAMEQIIFEATGMHTRILRFPGGSNNSASRRTPGLMTRMTKVLKDMGYRYFDWNVNPSDAIDRQEADEYRRRIVGGIKSHSDFAIVLQHDINLQSVLAVESVIQWGLEYGYTFRTLDLTSPVMESKIRN